MSTELAESKQEEKSNDYNKQEEQKSNNYKQNKFESWLSVNLQLDDFSIPDQTFVISGYINVFWKWPKKEQLASFSRSIYDYMFENKDVRKIDNIRVIDNNVIKVINVMDAKFQWFNKKLPIDARRIFDERTSIEVEHIAHKQPCLYYNMENGSCHLQMSLKYAKIAEELTLFGFPFDFHFLDLKINFKAKEYQLITPSDNGEIPVSSNNDVQRIFNSVPGSDSLKQFCNQCITVTMNNLLSREIEMFNPWLCFDDKVQLIRLRIVKKQTYHVLNVLVPTFLVILSGFCTFWLSDVDNRLAYIITVLLTFVALQNMVMQYLPHITEMAFIHYYVLCGYFVLGLNVIWSVVKDNDELQYLNGNLVFWISVGLWAVMNLLYFFLWIKVNCCLNRMKKENAICHGEPRFCIRCCSLYLYELSSNWNTRSIEEIEMWKNEKSSRLTLSVGEGSKIKIAHL